MKAISRFSIVIWYSISLLVYASVLISPSYFKYSGIISLAIPAVLILNIFWLVFWVFGNVKKAIYPLVLLIIGFPFLKSTFSFSKSEAVDPSVKVMSYNVMRMHKGKQLAEMKDWMRTFDADIKCFQEFSARKDLIDLISENGKYKSFISGYGNSYAIFTKHKILKSGALYEVNGTNNILYADIKIRKDTIRVYNVHLQSMSINPDKELNQDGFEQKYESVRKKFEIGSAKRATQINDLLNHISNCSYPVLIVGDFNDIPYSYNYTKLARNFDNAFEKAGKGFGFTYNGKIPFLRIDNHFFNNKLKVHSFETLHQVDYSDHFPTVGIYSISH